MAAFLAAPALLSAGAFLGKAAASGLALHAGFKGLGWVFGDLDDSNVNLNRAVGAAAADRLIGQLGKPELVDVFRQRLYGSGFGENVAERAFATFGASAATEAQFQSLLGARADQIRAVAQTSKPHPLELLAASRSTARG